MILFAGIDLSISCTGVAIVECTDDGKFRLVKKASIVTSPNVKDRLKKKIDSLQMFEFLLDNFEHTKDIQFFIFENYSYGSPGHLADLGELGGMYKHEISRNRKCFIDVIAPSSVKKTITNSGRASKEEVRDSLSKFVVDFDSIKFNNLDESDALAVAVAYGLQMQANLKKAENEPSKDN